MRYREADKRDVRHMAQLRAASWGTEDYWESRIAQYMDGTNNPRQALAPRVLYVAVDDESLTGLIAGHLTQRHGCQGELEWIDVVRTHRGTGVASGLLRQLATWFVGQGALKVCVDVEPENARARRFYTRHGARPLNPHWMVWDDVGVVCRGGQGTTGDG
jgi:GNAT superfamily N-acetyltransferase